MKVKYKHQNYKCSLRDTVRVRIYMFRLCINRQLRRVQIIFSKSDLLLYLLILVLWLVFGVVSFVVEGCNVETEKTYIKTLWELKDTLFELVIVAFVISVFNRIQEYRKILKAQHYMYVDAMDDFEDLFSIYDSSSMRYHYHSFYNDKCYKMTRDLYQGMKRKIDFGSSKIKLMEKCVLERIKSIESEVKKGNVICENEKLLIMNIDCAKKKAYEMEVKGNEKIYWELIEELYQIVDCLRWPWRRDEKINLRIIEILNHNPDNDIKSDFYMRMFLEEFSFEMIKRLLDDLMEVEYIGNTK